MLRNIFVFLFFFLVVTSIYGQLDPLFSTYQYNRLWYNPGYAGAENKKTFSFVTRNQWQVGSNPFNSILSYDQPFKKTSKSSIGGVLMYDRIGNFRFLQAGVVYSYKIVLSEKASLRLGAQVSLLNFKTNFSSYKVVDMNDPVYQQLMNSGNVRETKLDADLGAWLAIGKSYVGLSTKHIFEPAFSYGDFLRHYYFTMGTEIGIAGKLKMNPSAIARFTKNADAMDITNLFSYNNTFLLGGSFRWNNSSFYPFKNSNPFIVMAGINISDKFQLLFSYDIPATYLGRSIEGNIKVRI